MGETFSIRPIDLAGIFVWLVVQDANNQLYVVYTQQLLSYKVLQQFWISLEAEFWR
jgi:hypothetical protein